MGIGSFFSNAVDKASANGRAAAQKMSESLGSVSDAISEHGHMFAEAGKEAAFEAARDMRDGALWTGGKVVDGAVWTGGKAVDGAVWAVEKSVQVGEAVVDGAVWTAEKTVEIAEVVDTEITAAKTVAGYVVVGGAAVAATKTYQAGSSLVSATVGNSPAVRLYKHLKEKYRSEPEHCLPCENGQSFGERAGRINNRNHLIRNSKMHHDPQVRAAAGRLERDMDAVDLARLSKSAYNFNSTSQTPPPAGWSAAGAADLGITDPAAKAEFDAALRDAKATLYRLDESFPGGPKTVLAFRGTASDAILPTDANTDDIVTDVDQAMGMKTAQYTASMQLGAILGRLAPDTVVTGHSLGGGKAQAAGVVGGLKGTMFNAAGLNPRIIDPSLARTINLEATGAQNFSQYRSDSGLLGGDPLTNISNSPELQSAVFAAIEPMENVSDSRYVRQVVEGSLRSTFADNPAATELIGRIFTGDDKDTLFENIRDNMRTFGTLLPPTLGPITEVTPLSDDAEAVGSGPGDQHNLVNLINGIEDQKYNDIKTMLTKSGNQSPISQYITTPGGGGGGSW